MAYTTFAGNAASFPAAVRAATGSDPRNATTEAATASDLADRTAYLNQRGPLSCLATLSALIAATDTSPKFVDQYGWYSYTAATLTPINGVIYAATGVGSGSWVRQDRGSLFASSDEGTGELMRIDPRFLQPQYQYTAPLVMSSGARLAVNWTNSTLSTVTASTCDIGPVLEGDIITGVIGPLMVYNGHATTNATLVIQCQDNATGASPATPIAEVTLDIPGNNDSGMTYSNVGTLTIPFQHTVGYDGAVLRFVLRAAAPAGSSLWLTTLDVTNYTLGQITMHRGYVP